MTRIICNPMELSYRGQTPASQEWLGRRAGRAEPQCASRRRRPIAHALRRGFRRDVPVLGSQRLSRRRWMRTCTGVRQRPAGAGPGTTIQDGHGDWAHAATMRISLNGGVRATPRPLPGRFRRGRRPDVQSELLRRLPVTVADGPFDQWAGVTPEWMLLSFRAAVTTSSSALGYRPALAARNGNRLPNESNRG